MVVKRPKVTQSEDRRIMQRLTACLPASRFEMQTLCRLTAIKTTRQIPSAAVECSKRPRLLINPDFVKKYCPRDEHLFLLVMHELWHVMLAHTRMYPRMTEAQNIAFDAIINAGLMRHFNRPEYRGFFEAVNPADKFPHCLLRPPEGWPASPVYPKDIGPPGTEALLERLYPIHGFRRGPMPLYEEVLNLLLKSGMPFASNMPFLLGNHDGQPVHDPLIKDMIQQATRQWPKIPIDGRGQSDYGVLGRFRHTVTPTSENVRRVFSRVLQISLGRRKGHEVRKEKTPVETIIGNGVLPNPRDRMSPARRQLGAPSTLWAQQGKVQARVPEHPSKAHVYLDVSGSMNYILPHLLGLLLPYVLKGQADVFQFSTKVEPLSPLELKQGHLKTTGGTNINCVLEHILQESSRVERVLVLTDGATGAPSLQLAQGTRERNLRMNIVLPHDGVLHQGVVELAASIVTLPPVD